MKNTIFSFGIIATLFLFFSNAQSAVIGGSDNVVRNDLSDLTTVGDNSIDLSDYLYAFDEKIYDGKFASHFIAYDPKGLGTINAQVSFDNAIIAVIHSSLGLETTDNLFALNSIEYLSNKHNGIELYSFRKYDSFTVSGSTINVDFRASNPGDYIRVVTDLGGGVDSIRKFLSGDRSSDKEIVKDVTFIENLSKANIPDIEDLSKANIPEPNILALMGLGLVGLGYRRYRSKKAA